ncbi:hypothetical protein D3C86_1549740 [compost metagenome]
MIDENNDVPSLGQEPEYEILRESLVPARRDRNDECRRELELIITTLICGVWPKAIRIRDRTSWRPIAPASELMHLGRICCWIAIWDVGDYSFQASLVGKFVWSNDTFDLSWVVGVGGAWSYVSSAGREVLTTNIANAVCQFISDCPLVEPSRHDLAKTYPGTLSICRACPNMLSCIVGGWTGAV